MTNIYRIAETIRRERDATYGMGLAVLVAVAVVVGCLVAGVMP